MSTASEIASAARLLRSGELVAFPTETVYGLGANALDPIAVAKIFELKERPHFDPLIVHIADRSRLSSLVIEVPELAEKLIDSFWPGPLSLVLQKQDCIPDIVTSGLPSVAIRCPSNQVARRLIKEAGVPVAAPSANKFGKISPTTAQHVKEQFGDCLVVLDDGPCQVGVESTVVSFVDGDNPVLLRPGGITLEQIEQIAGSIKTSLHEESQPSSPGQLLSHYAPSTRLVLVDSDSAPPFPEFRDGQKRGQLCFAPEDARDGFFATEILSPTGDFREAAANLFAAMRRLDSQDLDLIVAFAIEEVDLGHAIMDRLRRAAAQP